MFTYRQRGRKNEMKKLLTALLCATMVLGVSGCGGKKELTENKDIYAALKDAGYTFENEYGDIFIKGKIIINLSATDKSRFMFVYKDGVDDVKLLATQSNEEPTVFQYFKNDCRLIVDNNTYTDDCSDIDKKDIEDVKEFVSDELDNLQIDEKTLFEFCKWYYSENAKSSDSDDSSTNNTSFETTESSLEKLGYTLTNGAYMTTDELKIGDATSKLTIFMLDEKYFGFSLDGTEKGLIAIDYNEDVQSVSFQTNAGQSIYSYKDLEWIENPSSDEDADKAFNYYKDFLTYCSDNNINLE